MPELPEVEICRRQLRRWSQGAVLRDVLLCDPAAVRKTLSTRPSDAVEDAANRLAPLIGRAPQPPIRHGKRLGWAFGDIGLGIHLGMTGQWIRGDNEQPRSGRVGLRFDHVVLWFVDQRRFGGLTIRPTNELPDLLSSGHGPDALDAPCAGPQLAEIFTGRRAIKVALLDQSKITGLGNIHAAEALWRAGIHPGLACNALSTDQWRRLSKAIPDQLQFAVDAQDGDEIAYITAGGPNPFAVYGREKKECPKCNAEIQKISQSGRSTFLCPSCQRG